MTARILAPTADAIAEAARVLQQGGLVAFPTETVYGLGANALDEQAVARIFAAKGRPASNPLIVHAADATAARELARSWPTAGAQLAAAHWPGPLTLVVQKTNAVPPIVTAGGDTVGLRVPAHPVALALLRAAGVPLAAPSANRSEQISPTTAQHVADSLGPFVDDLLILDGGPCEVGIESTVIDVTGASPVVLRPGMLRIEADAQASHEHAGAPARAPGQRARHYAPDKPLVVASEAELLGLQRTGDAWLRLPGSPAAAAAMLYAGLRQLDADPGVSRILIIAPPEDVAWAAIRDRLRRAAH